MKRANFSDSPLPTPKRPKLAHDDPFAPDLERTVASLYDDNTDTTGFVRVKAYMIWPVHSSQLRLQVRALQEGTYLSFEVLFSERCSDFFHTQYLHFDSTDEFCLSLRGASIKRKKPSGAPSVFPILITYPEGVVVKFLRTARWGEEDRIVDTWKLQELRAKSQTPPQRTPDPYSTPELAVNSTPQYKLPSKSSSPKAEIDWDDGSPIISPARSFRTNSLPSDDDGLTTPRPPAQANPKSTKPRHLKLSKRDKKALIAARRQAELKLTETTAPDASSEVEREQDEPPPPSPPSPPSPPPPPVVIPTMKTGFRNEEGVVYSPLSEVTEVSKFYNVIGVVARKGSPEITRMNERSWSFSMVDPSNYGSTSEEGFKSVCFTPKYPEWLPASAEIGDVLILNFLKAVLFQDSIRGTGYGNRLKWAIYSPSLDVVHHGHCDEKTVPRAEGLASGHGYSFSPFRDATPSEVAYCKRLADWWAGIVKAREAQDPHSPLSPLVVDRRGLRRHRTISEADPDAPPSGFFDGTVEVLHGASTDRTNVYTLFVTDYSENQTLYPTQADWAPPGLSQSILKVEMWDDASEMGPTLSQGQYYSMKNLRARLSTSGYLEAKIVETKITPLDAAYSMDVHLQALIERKTAWEQSCEQSCEIQDGKHMFAHSLLQDVEIDQRFTCTVELLSVEPAQASFCFIHVTDYTSNNLIGTQPCGDHCIKTSVLKVQLSDGQTTTGGRLEPGFFCQLRNLKLKRNSAGDVRGYLGGDQRLIMKLQTTDPQDTHLEQLLKRKRELTNAMRKTQPPSTPALKENRRSYLPIRDVEDAFQKNTTPVYIWARAVDLSPMNLKDSLILHCSNCKTTLPKTQKACFECGDSDYEFVRYYYRLALRLVDEYGDSLVVAVTHKSTLLDGVRLADFDEGPDVFQEVERRLKPYIGNIRQVHNNWVNGTDAPVQTSFFYWKIISKMIPLDDNSSELFHYVMDIVGD